MPRKPLDRRRAERERKETPKTFHGAHRRSNGAFTRIAKMVLLCDLVALNCERMGLNLRDNQYRITGRIDSIEKQIRRRQEKLESLQGLGGVFRLKLKATLMNEITDLMEERRKQQALLDETVIRAGYWNVASFLKAYEKAKKAVTEYRKYKKQHPGTRNTSGDPGRESVLKKLAEYEKEGKRKQAGRTASQGPLRKPAASVDGMENALL